MQSAENVDTRTDAIAGRLRRLLNEGMVALVAGLGSRDGWLDALLAIQPAGVVDVARAAGAEPGRVGAWLAALVAGRLVDHDGARGTYALAPDLTNFLVRAEGRAYRRALEELVALAGGAPRSRAAGDGGPTARELVALVPGMTERLVLGADVLELRRAAVPAAGIAAAFPACRLVTRARPTVAPRASFALALAMDERALAGATGAARLAAALAPGGTAVIAVPALSGSPADDSLHPVGAYLLGARALAAPVTDGTGADALGARLAAAGLVVRGLARVASDPFCNYLIARKPDSTNQ
jgi:hypothetical protein